MVITLTRHAKGACHCDPVLSPAVSPPQCPLLTESRFAQRRELPSIGTASMRCLSQRYPTFIARTGSCVRPKPFCRLQLSLVRQIFAGCDEPLLGVGPSRRYLCDLCIGAWIRTPPRPIGASVRCFPIGIGLSLGSRRSARDNSPQNSFFARASFRGCNHSLMFRLPYLLGPLAVLTRGRNLQPPGRIHRAEPVPLPDTGTGITTCPNPDN